MKKVFSRAHEGHTINNQYFSAIQYPLSQDGIHLHNPMMTSGRSSSLKLSTMKAYAEFEERLSVLYTNSVPAKLEVLHPKWMPFSSHKNKKLSRLLEEKRDAVQALSWGDFQYKNIPVELIYFGSKTKKTIFPSIDTTGCATHVHFLDACKNATYELIEKNCLVLSFIKKQHFGLVYEDKDISYFDISFFLDLLAS